MVVGIQTYRTQPCWRLNPDCRPAAVLAKSTDVRALRAERVHAA